MQEMSLASSDRTGKTFNHALFILSIIKSPDIYIDNFFLNLNRFHKSENFSQNCHLNYKNKYHLLVVHHIIHPNMQYVTVDERTSLRPMINISIIIIIRSSSPYSGDQREASTRSTALGSVDTTGCLQRNWAEERAPESHFTTDLRSSFRSH